MLLLVRRAHNGPQARLAFRNRGKAYGRSKNSSIKQLLRKVEGLRRVSDVDRHNRRLAAFELESALLQLALEELRVRPQFLHQFLASRRIEQGECGHAGGCRGRGM